MAGLHETVFIILFCVAVFIVKRFRADRSDATEEGSKALESIKFELLPITIRDGPIGDILSRFRAARDLKYPPHEIHVMNGLSPNAASLPGGHVLITQGLLDLFESHAISIDEMAAIVAHEIGHSELSHWRRRKKAKATGDLIASIVSIKGGIMRKAAANLVTEKGFGVLSHADEFQADEYSVVLLADSGFSTLGLATVLHKLDSASLPSFVFLLTQHPPTDQRIDRILKHQQTKGGRKSLSGCSG